MTVYIITVTKVMVTVMTCKVFTCSQKLTVEKVVLLIWINSVVYKVQPCVNSMDVRLLDVS